MIYQLIHIYYDPAQERGDWKSLGHFSSIESCQAVVDRAKNSPGYEKYPNQFYAIPIVQHAITHNAPVFVANIHFYDNEFCFEEWFIVGYSNHAAELKNVLLEFEERSNMFPQNLTIETQVENLLLDHCFFTDGFTSDNA